VVEVGSAHHHSLGVRTLEALVLQHPLQVVALQHHRDIPTGSIKMTVSPDIFFCKNKYIQVLSVRPFRVKNAFKTSKESVSLRLAASLEYRLFLYLI
jgi:hypothetical protein